MSKEVFINTNWTDAEWENLMHSKCKCGHDLYQHAFSFFRPMFSDPSRSSSWVSQCGMCLIVEGKFSCESFDPV